MMRPQVARVTTFVRLDPGEAFDVFTKEIDSWWRRGPRYRVGRGEGTLRFEGGAGGRLVEVVPGGGEEVEIGRVLAWDPGVRLAFEWRGRNFAPGEVTQVEIRFERAEGGTSVALEHRGWEAIAAKHPVRHGLTGTAFTDMIGLWWGELLTSYRAHAARNG
ncbi:MAG TPA: SRPBCC domain-containing protein [Myxococcales bacterium]|nr:SRPBCC domain-containing protein [Myxococcales bacterium]